jgi:hypothetical protein
MKKREKKGGKEWREGKRKEGRRREGGKEGGMEEGRQEGRKGGSYEEKLSFCEVTFLKQ